MVSRLQQTETDESVHSTHANPKSFTLDVRLSLQMSVESVKEKLWKKCGTSVNVMCLELYDDSGAKIPDLTDNSIPLGFYSPLDGTGYISEVFSPHVLYAESSKLRRVKGIRYLTARLHGVMIRPDKVKVGDNPERDPFDDGEDEI